MDLREKKTKRSIKNAFLQLRRKKALERITVTELSALAEISKATFYLHYKDIYDLSEQMQEEVIQKILGGLTQPGSSLTGNKAFTEALFYAFHGEQSLIETLFSGSQSQVLPLRIEKELLELMKKQQKMDKRTEMLLSYTVYGSYCVYQKYHKECTLGEIISLVKNASQSIYAGEKEE